MSKFKVGQVWRDGEGRLIQIIEVDNSQTSMYSRIYPVTGFCSANNKHYTYTEQGWHMAHPDPEVGWDLVELVKDDQFYNDPAEPVAYMWSYYQNDSLIMSGVVLTRQFAEEILKNDKPFGYTGTITPLYAGTTEEIE